MTKSSTRSQACLLALTAVFALSAATPTFAAERWQHKGGWGGGHARHDWGGRGGGGGGGGGIGVGGVLLGLGVGAALGAAIAAPGPVYAAPPPVYYAPPPVQYGPPPAVYYGY